VFTRSIAEAESKEVRQGGRTASLWRVFQASESRAEWIQEALQELRSEGNAERVGVWLEEQGGGEGEGAWAFRGQVWEGDLGGEMREWERLPVEAPLPLDTLRAGMSSAYEVARFAQGAIVGPELELRSVVWAPVMVRQSLRGLVMQGTRSKWRELPRENAEKVAAELGILLELEEERRLAAARKADLDFGLRLKRLLSEEQSITMIFNQLAESCTRAESFGGAGTVFALVGELKKGPAPEQPKATHRENHVLIRAESGDETWSYGANGGPLEMLWRQAMENRRVAGAGAESFSLAKDISRIVAVPVVLGEDVAGVILAGLAKRRATLETLDRLEWRATLAGEVLQQERRLHADAREKLWWKALLESSGEAAILADRQGWIAGMSRGARVLLQDGAALLTGNLAEKRFVELFVPQHEQTIQSWISGNAERSDAAKQEKLECELKGGFRVLLRRPAVSGEAYSAIALERIETQERQPVVAKTSEALQQAIDWLEEGVAVFDNHGAILARNMMFLRYLGLDTAEGRGLRTLAQILPAAAKNAAQPELFAAEWRTLSNNDTEAVHEELSMAQPVAQVIQRYARPILGENGKNLGRVEVYRPASAGLKFQSKLEQAEKLASLGHRVTRIVHELNNPLTTILGNAQRMAQREGADQQHGEARQILQEAERASGIVRQLLNLPREARPELQRVSLNELVESTVDLQRASLDASRVKLQVDTEVGLPRVRGDRGQLQQVLLNLLQNAQQAIQESGKAGSLLVRTASVAPGRVKLEVQDDGPGIPETLQSQIFDPFFTTKPPDKGTGLGLAIVSGFVRQHGGTIAVHSRPGEGARFTVELPAAEEAWQPDRQEDRFARRAAGISSSESMTAPADGKAPRILVVEDEPTVAALIGDVLREEGMVVDILPDGRNALELTKTASYDLAICDLRMPGMDGQDFYAALVEAQSPLKEHILFVTGDGVAQRTNEFLAQHRLPHVAKPFRVEELTLAVRSLLWGSLHAAAAGAEHANTEQLGNWKKE
jgi:signal transduction histidine kinase/FixJ family two-component response regulator